MIIPWNWTHHTLGQLFLTVLEVLNPTGFMHAFIKPFVVGEIKWFFS